MKDTLPNSNLVNGVLPASQNNLGVYTTHDSTFTATVLQQKSEFDPQKTNVIFLLIIASSPLIPTLCNTLSINTSQTNKIKSKQDIEEFPEIGGEYFKDKIEDIEIDKY